MPDVFHSKYREVNEKEKILMQKIKDQASGLLESLESIVVPDTDNEALDLREINFAIAKLEETVMWAIKAITK